MSEDEEKMQDALLTGLTDTVYAVRIEGDMLLTGEMLEVFGGGGVSVDVRNRRIEGFYDRTVPVLDPKVKSVTPLPEDDERVQGVRETIRKHLVAAKALIRTVH